MAVRFKSIPLSLRRRTVIVMSASLLIILVVALTIVRRATGRSESRNATVIRLNERAAGQMSVA